MSTRASEPLPKDWPAGRSLAISVNVMLEGWTDDAAPGLGPMGNPLKRGTLDLQARSWAAYGPRAGAWRILDVLAAKSTRAVFYVSGIVAERHPELVRAIADAGHAVAAHSWAQNVVPASETAESEAHHLARCVAVLEQTSGARPRGWLSPRCTPSARTTALLAAEGFTWHADFFDRDLPSIERTDAGPIVAMPFTMEVNDLPLAIAHGNEPEAFPRIVERLVADWPSLPSSTPACVDITVHAHVFGRPAGALQFARALDIVHRYDAWSWLTEHRTLAGLWAPGI